MLNKRCSFILMLAMLASLFLVVPAAAKTEGAAYTGTETFVQFVDPGTVMSPGGNYHLRGQTIVNVKFSSDDRLTGINIVTFQANLDKTGTGPANGKFAIQSGTFEWGVMPPGPGALPMVFSFTNPCDATPPPAPGTQCYQYQSGEGFYPPYLWLVFHPNGGGWEGNFHTVLSQYGLVPLTGHAEGNGTGIYAGLKVTADSDGYTYSGTIR
jgi:hypothetical protein